MKEILNFVVLVSFLTGFATLTSCIDKEKILIHIAPKGIPSVTTSIEPESITATSVIAEGDVISEGDAPVTIRGFTFGEGTHGHRIYSLSGTGKFTLEITGLFPGEKYHIRAYAINEAGTAYGNVVGFGTLGKPEVTTDLVTVLSQTEVAVDGSVTMISSSDIMERGICYGTVSAPTAEGLRVLSTKTELGTFTCNLQNLIPGTRYYVRAYISIERIDDWWEALIPFYGNEISFTAGDPGPVH